MVELTVFHNLVFRHLGLLLAMIVPTSVIRRIEMNSIPHLVTAKVEHGKSAGPVRFGVYVLENGAGRRQAAQLCPARKQRGALDRKVTRSAADLKFGPAVRKDGDGVNVRRAHRLDR